MDFYGNGFKSLILATVFSLTSVGTESETTIDSFTVLIIICLIILIILAGSIFFMIHSWHRLKKKKKKGACHQ